MWFSPVSPSSSHLSDLSLNAPWCRARGAFLPRKGGGDRIDAVLLLGEGRWRRRFLSWSQVKCYMEGPAIAVCA